MLAYLVQGKGERNTMTLFVEVLFVVGIIALGWVIESFLDKMTQYDRMRRHK
jgi:hypothetical protein